WLRRNIYAVDGTDQDWMRARFGTIALLVEAARVTPRDTCQRRLMVEANRPTWQRLLEALNEAPMLALQVVDHQGRPVAAVAGFKSQRLPGGERWTTRPSDGRMWRVAPGGVGRDVVEVWPP